MTHFQWAEMFSIWALRSVAEHTNSWYNRKKAGQPQASPTGGIAQPAHQQKERRHASSPFQRLRREERCNGPCKFPPVLHRWERRCFPGLKEPHLRRHGSAYMLERPNGRAPMGLFRRRREEAGPLRHNNAVSAVSARLKKRPDPAEPFDGAKNVEKIPLLFVMIMPVNQSAIRFGRRAPETFGSMRALSQCVFQVKHGCVSLRRQGLGPAALPPAVGPRIFA